VAGDALPLVAEDALPLAACAGSGDVVDAAALVGRDSGEGSGALVVMSPPG